jgi:hypothetical protein
VTGSAFDREVSACLDAVMNAAVAEILAADTAQALTRAGLAVPLDLEAIVRCSLCADLEPTRDPDASRVQLAALVNSLETAHG